MPDDMRAPSLDKLAATARARVEAAILFDAQRESDGDMVGVSAFSKKKSRDFSKKSGDFSKKTSNCSP